MTTSQEMSKILKDYGIAFTLYETGYPSSWPPPLEFWKEKNLQRCKNLFFRDNHGKNHFFVVLDFDRDLDIGILKTLTGHHTLSFASPQRLKKFLDQEPGGVSVLGLVNDKDNQVKVYLDKALDNGRLLAFLPGEKSHFFGLTFEELKHFLRSTCHTFEVTKLY